MFDLSKNHQYYPTVIISETVEDDNDIHIVHDAVETLKDRGQIKKSEDAIADDSHYESTIMLRDKKNKKS